MLKESAIPYGMNLTASDAQGAIKEAYKDRAGVNTWTKLLNQAGADYTREMSALQEDYSEAIGEAYKSSLKNRENIDRLGLATGSRNELLLENRDALMDAYETYLSKYASGTATAMENYGSNVSAIEQALGDEAGNVSKILGKLYDYAAGLQGASKDVEGIDEFGNLTKTSTDIYDYFAKQGLSEFVGYDANNTAYLKPWSELSTLMFDRATGQLTEGGRAFYTTLMDQPNLAGFYQNDAEVATFGRWLAENDPELFEWYNSPDPYNYTEDGRRSGTIRSLLGKMPTDYGVALSGDKYRQEHSTVMGDLTKQIDEVKGQLDRLSYGEFDFDKLYDKLETGLTEDELRDAPLDDEEAFINYISQITADKMNKDLTRPVTSAALQKYREGEKYKDWFIILTKGSTLTDEQSIGKTASTSAYDSIKNVYNTLPSISSLKENYETLYGIGSLSEDTINAYEAERAKLDKFIQTKGSKDITKAELNEIRSVVDNMSKILSGLGGTAKSVSGDYGTDVYKNAATGLEKIDSANENNRKQIVDEAYDAISNNLSVTLGAVKDKSRKRDLIISYGEDNYFTVDRDKTNEVTDVSLKSTLNNSYKNSLLAVVDGKTYMQYKGGMWIRVYPKIGGDKGSEQRSSEQNKILQIIAYKMMSDNNMDILDENNSDYLKKQVWITDGKIENRAKLD